jgi:hypothetical protein
MKEPRIEPIPERDDLLDLEEDPFEYVEDFQDYLDHVFEQRLKAQGFL